MEKETERTEGMNLRDARTSAGLTLQELAALSGVGWGTIQAIESGRTPGNLIDKMKLADALRRGFAELFPSTHGEVATMLTRGFKRDGRIKKGTKAAK